MNAYGPAECADDVALHTLHGAPAPSQRIAIGQPTDRPLLAECSRSQETAFGPERVKTPGPTLAMISEPVIAREAHEMVYPG